MAHNGRAMPSGQTDSVLINKDSEAAETTRRKWLEIYSALPLEARKGRLGADFVSEGGQSR